MKPDDSGKPPSRKQFRQALSKLSHDELVKLVGDLYSVNPDNRRFLEAKFAMAAPLETYKEIIRDAVYPDVMKGTAPISFATARKAISDYKKATGDQKGVLELMVHAVECGNSFTVDYGDIDEQFYNNLESLFRKTLQLLKTMDEQTTETFLPRLEAVVEAAHGIGWGYYDEISDALAESFPQD